MVNRKVTAHENWEMSQSTRELQVLGVGMEICVGLLGLAVEWGWSLSRLCTPACFCSVLVAAFFAQRPPPKPAGVAQPLGRIWQVCCWIQEEGSGTLTETAHSAQAEKGAQRAPSGMSQEMIETNG